MGVLKVWRINAIRIEPYPFFYVDYVAEDSQKLAQWELAMLDHSPREIINTELVSQIHHLDLLEGYLVERRTKVFDDHLKEFTKKLVRSFINHFSFGLHYLPNNRISLDYCLDDLKISDEIYNHRIKVALRDLRRRISDTLDHRLREGDDLLVEERPLPLR